MRDAAILLVEDNDDDVALTLRAFKKKQHQEYGRGGAGWRRALDYLFATGSHRGRTAATFLRWCCSISNCPARGPRGLAPDQAEEATKTIADRGPDLSKEEQDLIASYRLGCNSYVRKPVDFDEFVEAARQLGLYWLLLTKRPPR